MVNTVKNFLIMLNYVLQMHLKLFQKIVIQKTASATADLIGNKFDDITTRVSKPSPKNNSEINKEEEILREKFILSELIQNLIDDIRLKEENY